MKLTQAFDKEARAGCDAEGHALDRRHPWAQMGDLVGVRAQSKQDWVRKALEGRYDWRHRKLEDW